MPRAEDRGSRTRLTRRGWTLLGAALGLVIGGRILGLPELYALAAVAALLLAGATLWVRTRHLDLTVTRTLFPARLHVGGEGRVDLVVERVGRRATPVVSVTDVFDDGRRAARFLLPPLAKGTPARAAYRVPTARRGRFPVGPLTFTVSDPFGLARRAWIGAGTDEVIVCPRIHDILAPLDAAGRNAATAETMRAGSFSADGEDFLTLRDYEAGDELRRIHWRSTARTGELMVRQDEARTRAQATVVLDTRAGAHDALSFELAVEAAASIVARLSARRRPVEIITSSGERMVGTAVGSAPVIMDRLAGIEVDHDDRFLAVTTGVRANRGTGLLVVITGRLSSEEFTMLVGLGSLPGLLTLVATRALPQTIVRSESDAPLLVVDASSTPFATAWNEMTSRWTSAAFRQPSASPR